MKFATIEQLHWLWAVILLGIVFYISFGFYRRKLSTFVAPELSQQMGFKEQSQLQIVRIILLLTVFTFSVIALARPQWGFEWQEVKRQGVDILLLIDTSKSMLTRDVRPNRLERVKLAVQDLVKIVKGDRIGLIAFAGDAFMTCPLTIDTDGFLLSLNDLSTDTIPRGGTNIGSAVTMALNVYKDIPNKYKAIMIVTDGDNLEGDPLGAAQKAKEQGVKIYTIGIGTKEGDLIQVADDKGALEFLKDEQGNFVKSRLNETTLQQIAMSTGGSYIHASGAHFGLDAIYQQEISKLEKRELESKVEKRYHERFQIPLAIALILLVIESCLYIKK